MKHPPQQAQSPQRAFSLRNLRAFAVDVDEPAYNRLVHFVYMVRCADGTLYTGYARDPHEREKVHNSGRGAHYTACRRPVRLVYSESFESRGQALRREYQLKRLRRPKKEALIDA